MQVSAKIPNVIKYLYVFWGQTLNNTEESLNSTCGIVVQNLKKMLFCKIMTT